MTHPRTSNQSIGDFIATLVSGRKVLDVGCIGQNLTKEASPNWLHGRLAASAASVLGMDILEDEVRQLAGKGYRIACGDAMTAELSDKFDVIVAGELIEHLDKPGQFVTNMRRHLSKDGALVLTTPNVFYALHFLESVVASPYKRWNSEHVSWYCFFTLENLLKRNGMYIDECIYFARSRKIRKLLNFLHLPCPRMLASTMLAVAKPVTTKHEGVAGSGGCAA